MILEKHAAHRVRRSGNRAVSVLLLLVAMAEAGTVAASDWERPPGEEPRIYCDASQTGAVSRGRIYAVQFSTNGSPRAERSYTCTLRFPPPSPFKPEYKGTMTCTCVSAKEGAEYLLSGSDSSQSLFMSTDAREICAHAYGNLGIQAKRNP